MWFRRNSCGDGDVWEAAWADIPLSDFHSVRIDCVAEIIQRLLFLLKGLGWGVQLFNLRV